MAKVGNVKTSRKMVPMSNVTKTGPSKGHGTAKGKMNTKASTNKVC